MADPITDKLFHDAIFGEEQRRIVLCTTLRDFDEDVPEGEKMSENCQMQELFLRCVARQTYQNFRLVVTTFSERNDRTVRKAVDAIFDDPAQREKVILIREDLEGDYRFSMTSVLLNGIEEARKGYEPVVVWCGGDIVLQGNLFEALDKIYSDDLAGTSHPSLMTLSMKYFRQQAVGFPPPTTTFDMMFFAAKLLQDEEVLNIIKKYRFYDRGLFSAFLAGLALRSKNRVNLINISDAVKILNKRDKSIEPPEYLRACQRRNFEVLKRFVTETGADENILKACTEHTTWLHDLFGVIKPGPPQIPPRMTFKDVKDDLSVAIGTDNTGEAESDAQ